MQAVKEKTPMELFMERLQIQLANNYSQHQSEMVKRGMKSMVEQGYLPTRPPLGYQRTLTKGLFEPTRLGETIGVILQAIADESLPLSRAIEILQKSSESRTGRKSTRHEVLKLISNTYYAGFVSLQDMHYPGKHIPLITIEQYSAILKILRNSAYPIAKDLYCPVCDEL